MQQLVQDQQYDKALNFFYDIIDKESLPESLKISLGELYSTLTKENAVEVYGIAKNLCNKTWASQHSDFTVDVLKVGAVLCFVGVVTAGVGRWLETNYPLSEKLSYYDTTTKIGISVTAVGSFIILISGIH